MDHFSEFSIPILGLRDGEYRYQYQLDRSFFSRFEDAPIQECQLEVDVQLDKRPSMLIFSMQLNGTMASVCDQCTAQIALPLENEMELIVKHSETSGEDDEVVFIHPSTSHFNLAKYLYEFAVLSLPIVHTYDCEDADPRPCNMDVINKLNEFIEPEEDNPIWDALKGLKTDK